MTIIVFDGTHLAGDRAAWAGSTCYPVRKVYRIESHKLPYAKGPILVGIAGHVGHALEVLRWIREAGPVPVCPDDQKTRPSAIVIDQRRNIWRIQSDGLGAEPVMDRKAVFGAMVCEAMARGVLEMGGSARKAVMTCIKYTDSAALGVDVVGLR